MLLPEKRPAKLRKSFTIEQAHRVLVDAIPADARPAMWLTGLMCGLRPGELAGLRWCFVDIDSDAPSIRVTERALEVDDRYAGQVEPKTLRSKRSIGLHPLLVAALQRHRDDMRKLGLYGDQGFVFCIQTRRSEAYWGVRWCRPLTAPCHPYWTPMAGRAADKGRQAPPFDRNPDVRVERPLPAGQEPMSSASTVTACSAVAHAS